MGSNLKNKCVHVIFGILLIHIIDERWLSALFHFYQFTAIYPQYKLIVTPLT